MTADELAAALGGRRVRDHWMCQCPAHNDSDPSLKVTQADDRVLIHCWAGCRPEDVLKAAGLTWGDLFSDSEVDLREIEKKKDERKRQKELEDERYYQEVICAGLPPDHPDRG